MATTTTSDGVQIHYETQGSGRDVVLIHGLTDSSATWGPIPAMLADRYRVTTLDLRGHGQSADAASYDAVGMARDVYAVVSAAGLEGPLVIGHSLGGVVATAFAGAAPVRGAINVDQPLQLSSFQAGLREVEALLRDPSSFPNVIAMVFDAMDGDHLSPEIKADIASHRRVRQEVVVGVWNAVFTTPVAQLDAVMKSATSSITAPYLSLQFMEAPAGYTAWLQGLVPQATVQEWPGLGHYGHRIHPDRFVETVIAFDD
ncbi:MAG TPA: alpha/beta hydrolase [Ilumatobacteraceae bacterium]